MNSRRDKQILEAYRLLFSRENSININFIKNLNVKKIKSAYRARALETHPDRAKVLGINETILTRRFNKITNAYRDLYEFIIYTRDPSAGTVNPAYSHGKGPNYSSRARSSYTYTGKKHENTNHGKFRSGDTYKETGHTGNASSTEGGNATGQKRKKSSGIPGNSKLLFGQYLYFSGHISFAALLEAIFWQRKQRDLYGKIAMNWGILRKEDILPVLRNRKPFEKFGECAIRLGYINPFQHKAILYKQTRMQEQLGEYFVKEGIITRDELQKILYEYENNYKKN